ncbi:Golgi apparatus membrane protein TVP23 [Schizophyllum commune]
MSTTQPLLDNTIEPDEPSAPQGNIEQNKPRNARAPVVLTPTERAQGGAMATNPSDAESGAPPLAMRLTNDVHYPPRKRDLDEPTSIARQSAHPLALAFLYGFRIAAIVVYLFCGIVTTNYVLAVDDDGESYWVFESRDPSRPANPIDSKMFWTALYVFPALWVVLLIVVILTLNASFIPVVVLALVFNFTNVIGFTYADRDAKQRWAKDNMGGFSLGGLSGIGGQILTGAVKSSVGRVFGGR